jgi:hypothetical protein
MNLPIKIPEDKKAKFLEVVTTFQNDLRNIDELSYAWLEGFVTTSCTATLITTTTIITIARKSLTTPLIKKERRRECHSLSARTRKRISTLTLDAI